MLNISEIEKKIGYKFKDPEILKECLTHPSYPFLEKGENDYDRLEFLGDSVLGFIVADYLFRKSNDNEGKLTECKKNIVSSKPLCTATNKLGIWEYMLKSAHLKVTDNMKENLFESMVGAIYLDGGLEEAKRFIYSNLIELECIYEKDAKSELNEYVSKKHIGDVKYELISKTGLDNAPTFKVRVTLEGKQIAVGEGKSKKMAEESAAQRALDLLKGE